VSCFRFCRTALNNREWQPYLYVVKGQQMGHIYRRKYQPRRYTPVNSMFRVTAYITCTVHIQNSPLYTLTTLAVSVTDRVNAYFTCMHISTGRLGSRVASVLDSGAEGPGFKSQPRRCRVTSCSHQLCLCSTGSKIGSSPVKGCGVTAGLAESNGSLPPGL